MIAALPAPYAFPIGAAVRAGSHRGVVVAQPGPYSVRIRETDGRMLTASTTDLEFDSEPARAEALAPAEAPDLFSLL
ncbi:hypothetical protein GGR34_003737 [Microvirga flocculans]|uniref:Uncharacterized protein n=1 Tax=Microvirga flocculans TaxID=217168 RepID=A0A7W6IID8_9HYPH|nr:hypothetical protein [Microvirga flocculans]MBB4042052.1 hypothetical protein [Microvirga flocculans]